MGDEDSTKGAHASTDNDTGGMSEIQLLRACLKEQTRVAQANSDAIARLTEAMKGLSPSPIIVVIKEDTHQRRHSPRRNSSMEKLINGETHQRSQATQEVMQLEVHECGAHQTNQESSDPRGYATRSIHSLQSMPSSCEISFQSMAQDCMGWVIVIIPI